MTSDAVFGFVGVVLGSLTTSALTVYKERLVGSREADVRDQQYERDRRASRDVFQRESILALQTAVTDLIKAAYDELDRVLAEFESTGLWSARQWETPTAAGWSAAVLSLETSRARVFDEEVRSRATKLRKVAGESIWAGDLESAKRISMVIEPLQIQFHEAVATALAALY